MEALGYERVARAGRLDFAGAYGVIVVGVVGVGFGGRWGGLGSVFCGCVF